MTLGLVLIFGTWALAFALVPWAASQNGDWTLSVILVLGCSGSIVALCIQ